MPAVLRELENCDEVGRNVGAQMKKKEIIRDLETCLRVAETELATAEIREQGLRQLLEKAEQARDELKQARKEEIEHANRLEAAVEKHRAAHDDFKARCEAEERRADEYQERFEALRRDLALVPCHDGKVSGEDLRQLLARHTMAKGEKFEPAPPRDWGDRRKPDPGKQYPRATCTICNGTGEVFNGGADCACTAKPRPPYVPESAPFCWSVDGLGDEVGMWVEGDRVWIHNPDYPDDPWHWGLGKLRWVKVRRIFPRLWDDCAGLWRKVRGG